MPNSFDLQAEVAGERLDAFLVRQTGETRRFLKEQIQQGRVLINGSPGLKPSRRLRAGDGVRATLLAPPSNTVEAIEGPLEVLFEDEQVVVLNKAQGIAVHPAPTLKRPTLVHHLLHHLAGNPDFASSDPIRPGIVHRLDIGTSGTIVVAKNRHAHEALSRQFQNRTVVKTYECLVWGSTHMRGKVDFPIGRHPHDRKRMGKSTQGRESLTDWEKIAYFKPVTHLRVFPRTGRTHQIRVHLSETGFPLVGDILYARRDAQGFKNQLPFSLQQKLLTSPFPFLHAASLSFSHPTSHERVTFHAPRPELFDFFLSELHKNNL